MLYEDSSKQWIILIDENQNPADFFATLIHEYVHLCDYKKLTETRNNLPLRELQNDYAFLYWTEFHATFLFFCFFYILFSVSQSFAQNVF